MTATTTVDTKATTVDSEVVSDSTVTEVKVEAKSEPTEAKAETPEVKGEPTEAETKAEPVKGKAVAKATRELETVRFAQQRELTESYSDFGFLYHGHSPVANSIGLELGVVTKDEQAGTVQRTGFGFYLRSDHLADASFDSSDF